MEVRKLGDVIEYPLYTYDPDDPKTLKAPDSAPTAVWYEDAGTTSSSDGVTVTSITTGVYVVSINTASGNGFESGKDYHVKASAQLTGSGTTTQATYTEGLAKFALRSKSIDDLNDVTVTEIRQEIDSNSTQLSAILGYIDTEIAAIKAVTDNMPNAGTLSGITTALDTLQVRLTTARAVLLDNLSNLDAAVSGVGGDSAETIDTLLSTNHGAGSWSPSQQGSGAVTYTVNVTVHGQPEAGVMVQITTDVEGSNVIAEGVTDNFGDIVFQLDVGTYYSWAYKAGYDFSNPTEEVVS
nr:hypothetical protein 5 [Deltaproteobacteria bacterium]